MKAPKTVVEFTRFIDEAGIVEMGEIKRFDCSAYVGTTTDIAIEILREHGYDALYDVEVGYITVDGSRFGVYHTGGAMLTSRYGFITLVKED